MSYSRFIRDNFCHSYDSYDPDDEDEIPTLKEVGKQCRSVHDAHVEINNSDNDDTIDIGVTKYGSLTMKEYECATNEDFKVNRGNWKSLSGQRVDWRLTRFEDFLANLNLKEDNE